MIDPFTGKPNPLTALDPNKYFDDIKGMWGENSFDALYGMTGHSHMGRINWDKHPTIFGIPDNQDGESQSPFIDPQAGGAGKRLKGRYHTTAEQQAAKSPFGTKYLQGPYPLKGKNDGLLECPSSILNKDFEFHQNVM